MRHLSLALLFAALLLAACGGQSSQGDIDVDLIISGCTATCGCTVADYPRGRIAPGKDGYITVSFNSQGKTGQQYQEVTVSSNAQPGRYILKITAQISY